MSLTERPSPAPGAGPAGSRLADLLWLRSCSVGGHAYLSHARGGRELTFAGLWRAAARWEALLGDLGVARGRAVGIAVTDPVDFAAVFLATVAAGRVAAPLDPGAPDPELRATCERVRPVLVIADRPAPAAAPCEWLTLPPGSFELDDPDGGRPHGTPAVPVPQGPVRDPGTAPATATAPAGGLVLSTSGTTGAPKLIHLTEAQLLHTAGSIATHHGLSAVDTGFSPLPLFHINAEVVGLMASLVAGASLVLDDRFHRTGFWDLLEQRGVTWVNAVPAIVSRLAPLGPGEVVPPSVRFVRSASAPLPGATLARFERATGLPVVETYGMTEAGSQITANPVDGPRKPGSVGRPVGVELRVVAAGEGAGEPVGRVEIRGAGVIAGYGGAGYEDRFDHEGWLDTGDLGRVDADGYLYLVGRVDDVINRGGEKIFPREVEEVVLADPSVAAVAVVGSDHHELGRVPVAYVVLHGVTGDRVGEAAAGTVERIQERCVRTLSRAKRPVAFHVVDRLPAGATGKVRRSMIDPASAIYSLQVG
ncbi:MAG: AMP-binding protein [Acidimicrobiales bacterium]